jgi:type 1 glutamine amidotransferase
MTKSFTLVALAVVLVGAVCYSLGGGLQPHHTVVMHQVGSEKLQLTAAERGALRAAAERDALQAEAASADSPAKGKLKVVIIDGRNNHDWRATTPYMQQVLEACGRFTVDVSTMPQADGSRPKAKNSVKFPPELSQYDVVLSNYNNIFDGTPWPASLQKALEEYLKSGKGGLVVVHGANNAHQNWKAYNRMIGMGWRDNQFGDRLIVDDAGQEIRVPRGKGPGASHGPRHAFLITVRDAEHPITRGMPREWLHATDELYHGMRGPIEEVHLLATAYSDKKFGGTGAHEPMIWTVTYGKGRVFHTPMGHDLEAMRCVGFIATLQRGTEWAATCKVTVALPRDFPTATRTSSVPAK